jgi:hypothetical protein
MSLLKKLREPRIWKRIFNERLTEPLHLNALSALVAVFGTFRQRVAFDLIIRQYYAFAILKAADLARAAGLGRLTIVEFGVGPGAGLMNMCLISEKVSSVTGVDIKVFGFDTGAGMPPPRDYRDHPDMYQAGEFPLDVERLRRKLPPNGQLVLGNVSDTVPRFLAEHVTDDRPIGFVDLDVDYYSSSVDALKLLQGDARCYLPVTLLYVDDIHHDGHNPFAGELLAIREFNERSPFRKICRPEFLENQRVFRRAAWLKHIFYLHVMDHPTRSVVAKRARRTLTNPYLD